MGREKNEVSDGVRWGIWDGCCFYLEKRLGDGVNGHLLCRDGAEDLAVK